MIKKEKIIKSNWQSRPIGKTKRVKRKKTRGFLNLKPKNIFVFLIAIIFIGVVFISIFLAWLNYKIPNPEKLLERNIAQSTKIYDRTGQTVLYEIFAEERRSLVELEDLPQDLINATLVAEDKDFFNHPGFDLKAIARAIIIDVIRGGKVQGASTLTQQFVKNAFLTTQKTYKRKITELLLAYKIEKKYSKQEILKMYFNEIPYGSNAYGAESASQIYFGKSVKDLSLDECVILAALPKAPTYYSPYGNHSADLISRRDHILDSLVEQNYISEELSQQTKKIDTLSKITPRWENIIAPHFVMYIKELLTEKYGERLVEQGGLKVISSLDLKKQKIAEAAIEKYAKGNEKNYKAQNASLVSLDVATGDILAMVGSKDFFNDSIDGQVNITLSSRQPGSSFKPIVYAAAFEKGYTPDTILFDVETSFGPSGPDGKEYIPQNYNNKTFGPVTIRKALAGSLNIPGVKTLYLAGINNVLDLAQKMGYTTLTDKTRYGLSLVLGGGEIKLLEHVSAFSIFARDGKKIPYNAILRVEDAQRKILEEIDYQLLIPQQVVTPQTARLINNILSDNQSRAYVFGEKNNLTLADRPVATKTGTTNNFHDAWTIGYTPQLVTGVWVGNSRNEAMADKADGSVVAAPIWHEYMTQALANSPIKEFIPPKPIQTEKPILNGDLPGEITLEIDQSSGKLATELTPNSQKITKTFKQYYPILHYVDKNNPLGPEPKNPSLDPQYNYWLEGIKKWLASNPESAMFEIPPTNYDDVHIPSNQPQMEIIFPQNQTIISEQFLEAKIQAQAPRGINKIICEIDNIPLANPSFNANIPLYSCFLNLSGISVGNHELKITVYDDVENGVSKTIQIITNKFFIEQISWINPNDRSLFSQNDFPLNLDILLPAKKIKLIRFFSQNLETLKISMIGTIFNPEASGKISFSWPMADQGRHSIWAELIDNNNQSLEGEKIEIEVE